MSDEENVQTDTPEDDSTSEEITPPAGKNWWQFQNQEEAVEWANEKIQKRLAREKKKVDPLLEDHAKLKARVQELEPFEQATKSDSERWEAERASLAKELEDLRSYRNQSERTNLVREIADEKGLPARFITRVQGEDADSITADIDDLMTVLNDGKQPKPATRKPQDPDATPSSKGYSGGGAKDEPDNKSVVENIRKKFRENNNRTFAR